MTQIDVLAKKLSVEFEAVTHDGRAERDLSKLFGFVLDATGLDSRAYSVLQDAYEQSLSKEVSRRIPDLLEIHEVLVDGGHDEDNWRLFPSVGKACVLADYSEAPVTDSEGEFAPSMRTRMKARSKSASFSNVSDSKAFAVSGMDGNFVVVLTRSGGDWSVHVRQFWDSIDQLYKSGSFSAGKGVHSVEWAVEFASKVSLYSDDVPGVYSPRRPSLTSFSKGNFKVGNESAGIGLRYGDSRDAGFVFSFKNGAGSNPAEVSLLTQSLSVGAERALRAIGKLIEILKLDF